MSESQNPLLRKNNISAYLFLTTAILSGAAVGFFVIVFFLIFSSITAISTGGGASGTEFNFYFDAAWSLYLLLFLCLLTIGLQIAAFILLKVRSKRARLVGILAFAATIFCFSPFALLLIYPFAFLLGNNGKYFYQQSNN